MASGGLDFETDVTAEAPVDETAADPKAAALEKFHRGGSKEYNYRLIALLRSRHPLLFVSTPEEDRFINHLQHLIVGSDYIGYTWDCVNGLSTFNPNFNHSISEAEKSRDPVAVLTHIISKVKAVRKAQFAKAKGIVFVLLDFYKYLGKRADPRIDRLLRQLVEETRGGTVIVTGPEYLPSDGLGHIFESMYFPRPNPEEIGDALDSLVSSNTVQKEFPGIADIVQQDREVLINAVRGLTMAEGRAAFVRTIVTAKDLGHDPLDLNQLLEAKRFAINKSPALQYVQPSVTLDDVGGLGNFTDWVRDRKLAYAPEAREYGLPLPRGVMMVGIPGGGKSLGVKGLASYFNQPLVRFDFGAVMDGLVGSSEANIRNAIELAESMAPCVTGDAEVFDIHGNSYTVKELMDDQSLFADNSFFVNAFNEETAKIEKTLVKAIVKKPRRKQLVEIVTANAHLRVTNDHKMMIIRDGQFEWIEAGRLEEGDMVVSPKKLRREPMVFDLRSALDMKFDIDEKGIKSPDCDDVIFDETGFQVEAAAYIAGMIDGSGFLEEEPVLVFDGGDWASVMAYCVAMQSCFAIEPEISFDSDAKTWACYVTNDIAYAIVDYIRENLIKFNDDIVSAYITGFYESSAVTQVGRNAKVSFAVEEGVERDRLCKALHCVGIVAPKRTYRTVYVSSQQEIEALAHTIVDRVNSDHLRALIVHAVADCLRYSNHVGYMGPMEQDASQRMISQEQARMMLREGDTVCKTLVDSDVVGVRVMSVDPCGKDWVYDLSCEGNHNFFANNLLCHNCVLWVDEIEKALAAAVGKGSGDSGTTKRVLSTFLTWAQEKTAPVFLACTANNVEDIPPEFMRAGRFDEVFFIDLPDEEGRQQIVEIMLRLRGLGEDIKPGKRGLTTKKVAAHENLEGFSGAEIEKAVNEAMFMAFKEQRKITLHDIVVAAGTFKPLSKMRAEEFEAMREWAGENTRFANTNR